MENKKSLRLLITEECNLNCDYCCNKIKEVRDRFVYKRLSDIDFGAYSSVNITGGEPLLDVEMVETVKQICLSQNVPVYLYTNGTLVDRGFSFCGFSGTTVGVHTNGTMMMLCWNYPGIFTIKNIRFAVEDVHKNEYMRNIPDRYIKTWRRNDCYHTFDKEEFIVLDR